MLSDLIASANAAEAAGFDLSGPHAAVKFEDSLMHANNGPCPSAAMEGAVPVSMRTVVGSPEQVCATCAPRLRFGAMRFDTWKRKFDAVVTALGFMDSDPDTLEDLQSFTMLMGDLGSASASEHLHAWVKSAAAAFDDSRMFILAKEKFLPELHRRLLIRTLSSHGSFKGSLLEEVRDSFKAWVRAEAEARLSMPGWAVVDTNPPPSSDFEMSLVWNVYRLGGRLAMVPRSIVPVYSSLAAHHVLLDEPLSKAEIENLRAFYAPGSSGAYSSLEAAVTAARLI